MTDTPVCGDDTLVAVTLDPAGVICRKFLGFGVEWDSNGYRAAGITDPDFRILQRRVEWMRLPVVRIMMQAKWCYKGKGRYDWDDPQMQALYRHLDVCQKLGTTVLLTDWGIEPPWLTPPDVSKVEDPLYAGIIATYMDHLLNAKGYSCIRYFILVNEPNYEVKDWARWKAGVQHVAAAFRQQKLDGKIALMGADNSNADDWHTNAVDQLQQTLGAYDIHCYAQEDVVRAGALYDFFKKNWAYALANDPRARDKPFVVGECGFWTQGSDSATNPLHLDPRYGILMADYAVQAANAGSWAVLAWMLDDNSHANFTWGMCSNKAGGLKPKPWFYPWSLLARYFPSGASIVQTSLASRDVRVLAAYVDDQRAPGKRSWSFCIVNRADAPRTVRLQMRGGPLLHLQRYVYSASSCAADTEGFPRAMDTLTCNFDTGAEILCGAGSVVLLSSMDHGGQPEKRSE